MYDHNKAVAKLDAWNIKKDTKTMKMHICKTPEEYVTMFDVRTGSCMDRHRSNYPEMQGPMWNEAIRRYGIHPASWYYYTKSSKGCYFENDQGVLVGRAMLYKTGNKWYKFGDVHMAAGYEGLQARIVEDLYEQGYLEMYNHWMCRSQFRIPAIQLNSNKAKAPNNLYCPLPYGDFVEYRSMAVSFDDETNEFVFQPVHKVVRIGHHWAYNESSAMADNGRVFNSGYTYKGFVNNRRVPLYRELQFDLKKAA